MVTYRKASPGEMPEILDFINLVFSMAHRPHDFRRLLPKLYGEGNEAKSIHYIAEEEGKIQAVVCVLPITLCHNTERITCGTVGSVSVHPYSRQKGYMRRLMHLAVSDMKEEGISMSSLSGRRHRYQYYGYELGGYFYQYRFIPDNFRHCAGKLPQHDIRLERIDGCGDPRLPEMNRLLREQTVFAQRNPDDFFDICQSWNSRLYAVMEEEQLQGYAVLENNEIHELQLKDPAFAFSCLQSCLEMAAGKELLLRLYPHQISLMNEVAPFYEWCTVQIDSNCQIFNYPEVLQFFLNVKAEYCPLEDGTLDFTIEGERSCRITVASGKARVETLQENAGPVLTPFELISCMCSPEPGMRNRMLPGTHNWFPLPMTLCTLDKC